MNVVKYFYIIIKTKYKQTKLDDKSSIVRREVLDIILAAHAQDRRY